MVEVPEVILVTIDHIDPQYPKPGDTVTFVVTAHFNGRSRYNIRLEVVAGVTDPSTPCSENIIQQRKTFVVPAFAQKYTTVWRMRFDKEGNYKVCFGARILGIR